MIDTSHLDKATIEWLRDGPPPSAWVLQAVTQHARAHPRHAPLRLRTFAGVAHSSGRLARPQPGVRLAFLVALVVLALAAGGVLFAGYRGRVVTPTAPPSAVPAAASPGASATPSPAESQAILTPADLIDLNHRAWKAGRVADIPKLYTDQYQVVTIGAETLTDAHLLAGAQHFEILPGSRGWVYWEPRGIPFGSGAYWAEPMVAGTSGAGAHGFSVYRFSPDGRIRTVWAIVRPTTSVASHEALRATAAGTTAQSFLDRCLEARNTADGGSYAACFGDVPLRGWHVSIDATNGAWTSQYFSREALVGAVGGVGAVGSAVLGRIERSGPMTRIEDLVAYPFRSAGSARCLKGIDVVELTPEWDRIAERWTFCGSSAGDTTSLPSALQGTWSLGSDALTLTACSSGEACGRFERNDGNDHCVYPLTFVSGDAEGLTFWSGPGSTMGCAWSPWSDATLQVTVAPDGSLTISPGAVSLAKVGLVRVSAADGASPATSAR